ncbi:hypothetical protein BESB_022440 [Besnoitia besnoiti]|uniref:Uncharacterized protein n=1 Tax=Besnoitia besnoiti TaxID=94643 RepID=A0A2A9M8N0_BESBE|nr:hypothetical protein BESB_022440 [Besnoitia besnoiti]PFH31752.1 hypothetical protein BESB_022440 [Besnoitia besnoiti]
MVDDETHRLQSIPRKLRWVTRSRALASPQTAISVAVHEETSLSPLPGWALPGILLDLLASCGVNQTDAIFSEVLGKTSAELESFGSELATGSHRDHIPAALHRATQSLLASRRQRTSTTWADSLYYETVLEVFRRYLENFYASDITAGADAWTSSHHRGQQPDYASLGSRKEPTLVNAYSEQETSGTREPSAVQGDAVPMDQRPSIQETPIRSTESAGHLGQSTASVRENNETQGNSTRLAHPVATSKLTSSRSNSNEQRTEHETAYSRDACPDGLCRDRSEHHPHLPPPAADAATADSSVNQKQILQPDLTGNSASPDGPSPQGEPTLAVTRHERRENGPAPEDGLVLFHRDVDIVTASPAIGGPPPLLVTDSRGTDGPSVPSPSPSSVPLSEPSTASSQTVQRTCSGATTAASAPAFDSPPPSPPSPAFPLIHMKGQSVSTVSYNIPALRVLQIICKNNVVNCKRDFAQGVAELLQYGKRRLHRRDVAVDSVSDARDKPVQAFEGSEQDPARISVVSASPSG